MKEEKDCVEGFYAKCAELLGATHHYRRFPFRKRTRWNNRTPGNGRFEGFGLIRMFGLNSIHVALRAPVVVNRWFTSPEAVYAFLESIN